MREAETLQRASWMSSKFIEDVDNNEVDDGERAVGADSRKVESRIGWSCR